MNEKYFVADCVRVGEEIQVEARVEISEEEYQDIGTWFDFAYFYHTCKSVATMAIESGTDFLTFSQEIKNNKKNYDDREMDALLTTGNKLLINYLSFIKLFVDVIGNAISKKNKEKLTNFQEFNRKMYDNFFGYRFLTRLRNYVVHYDVPLSSISNRANDGTQLLCVRKNLLKYDKWNTVQTEINRLPEAFQVQSYIRESQAVLDVLYLKALETVAENVIKGNEKIVNFCKKQGIQSPVFLVIESVEEKKVHIEKLPLDDVRSFFEDLDRHPNYHIQINKI